MNSTNLVGRLTKNADLRYTPEGTPVATFTLAIQRTFTNQNGERDADYINCVAWRKTAENTANFTRKGSRVSVSGRLQSRSYEDSTGKRVYVTEVVAESVQFLDTKPTDGNGSGSNQNSNNRGDNNANRGKQGQGQNNGNQDGGFNPYDDPFGGGRPVNDDDLPF